MEEKRDMSQECGFEYEKAWLDGDIDEYCQKYCDKCIYMHEICMFGEE